MTKRNKKKKLKPIVYLILLIIISGSIYFIIPKNNKEEPKQEIKEIDKTDPIIKKLKELNYNDEEIETIKKYVKEENINYLIENNINKELAMNFINQDYYIDDYLKTYIEYYNNNNYDYREVTERVNTHVNYEYYTNTIETDETLGKFVLLNKYYYASPNYKAEDLIKVSSKYNLYNMEFELSEECYNAFLKMYNDAENKGYAFKINSPYRSYEKQQILYTRYKQQDGEKLADTYSARPGYSEHQTGYAFDIRDYPLTNDDYSKTKSFTWVSENAYKYGFIIRFPKEKEHITGYQYESWHYRYCGIECSTYIHNTGITYEEYYEYFIKYNNPKNLS